LTCVQLAAVVTAAWKHACCCGPAVLPQAELRTNIESVLNHVYNKHEEVGAEGVYSMLCQTWQPAVSG